MKKLFLVFLGFFVFSGVAFSEGKTVDLSSGVNYKVSLVFSDSETPSLLSTSCTTSDEVKSISVSLNSELFTSEYAFIVFSYVKQIGMDDAYTVVKGCFYVDKNSLEVVYDDKFLSNNSPWGKCNELSVNAPGWNTIYSSK